ncbi:MAG TPA: signal peptidase I [Bacteroidota bacterium]
MEKSEKRGNESEHKKQPLKDFFKDVVFVFGAFFVLNSFVLASFEVPTGSMEREIMAGDFLFVNKFIYGGTTPRSIPLTNIRLPWFRLPAFRDVRRGDVIVFEFPGQREEIRSHEFLYYLKRAMALSGDTIQIINRVVYVNGERAPLPRNITFDGTNIMPEGVPDPYGRIFPPGAPYNEDNWGPMVVPSKGDVIPLSKENFQQWRVFIGREGHTASLLPEGAVLINGSQASSYTVERDYIFGMGDHRDNSLDGRFWGFIPKENLVGTPMIVYWSWDPNLHLTDFFSKISTIKFGRIGTIIR